MLRHRHRWTIGLVAVLATVLTACGGGGGSEQAAAGAPQADPNGTLRFAWTIPAVPLDPHTPASSIGQAPYIFPVYDRLTQLVAGPELKPMVATKWEFSPDSKAVTFTLRDDVTFHDGTKVDSAAVKASLERALTLEKSTVKGQLSMIDGIDTPDPTTLVVRAERPASDLPYVLSSSIGAIINPKSLTKPDLDTVPDGSGPYTVAEYKAGDRVVYKRAANYWEPQAQQAATIELIGITNDNARLSALRSGQVDAILSKVGQYDQASALGGGYELHSYPAAATYAIYLNTARPHVDQAKVRQAFNYAIDREALNQSILDGQCAPQGQPLTQVLDGFLPNPPVVYGHDVAKAKQLLAEAGLPNGLDIRMLVGASLSPQDQLAPALQAQLAEAGIRVTIDAQDAYQLNALWNTGSQYDAYLNTRTASATAATTLRDNYLSPSRFPGPVPDGFAEAVNKAFDANLSAQDRTATLQQASTIAVDQAMDAFICALPTQVTHSDKVIGADSMGQSDFQGIFDLRYVGIAAG
ncbi:ABC transporter substrate-binding protein [Pseudonocardia pini]|uniref:ABC transporter substrate-binding protein n=1 Tax=Pseudonocardia pini TaxID=2758030 RepID=UPI0015F10CBE|nr:ABC transporter substrate-binding protein [Pseudonocardia pini]